MSHWDYRDHSISISHTIVQDMTEMRRSGMRCSHDGCSSSSSVSGSASSMGTELDTSPGGGPAGPAVIFSPDFFVEKLRHENPDVFLELVLSNISRLIDLPGTEFAQLLGEEAPKTPTGGTGGFFRSFNFLKRKGLNPSQTRVCSVVVGVTLA